MRRLSITNAARRHLRKVGRYVAAEAGRLIAERFVASIVARGHKIANLPGILGTNRPDLAPDLRSTPHRGYILYFRYLEDVLEIVAVLHASRDALAYFASDDE